MSELDGLTRAGVLFLLVAAVTLAPVRAAAQDMERGKRIFLEGAGGLPACAICHVLVDAGAAGAVGPDLDQLQPDAAKVRAAVRDGVGVMPPYAEVLTAEEIEAVAGYVAGAAGG